jgi:radical SAM superfamily enzyme YgiQ (UPF0313 family)
MRVYLCDLLHTNTRYRTFPYGIGCVAAYARAHLGDEIDLELIRTVEDLDSELARNVPDVIGFSNYIWNACLTDEVMRRVRARHPHAVVVVGGPNFPTVASEQREFLAARPMVDFGVAAEGEPAFLGLLRVLIEHGGSAAAIRKQNAVPPGCHYLDGGVLVSGTAPDRLRSLEEVPSPYLTGLLDKFFEDGGYSPLTQTKRGCPFACTFCVEGLPVYNRVSGSSADRFEAELTYMATRLRAPEALQLADANFGMYQDDLEACRRIARVRGVHGWPRHIEVSTGKNHKERILEAARITGGAFRLTAALQSTDPRTLHNIKRSNISADQLVSAAQHSRELGQRSYAELILGLPGDDRRAYMESIRASIDAGLDRIQLYRLVLLPGTELAGEEARRRFGMRVWRRPLPYSSGEYRFGGERFTSEEIVDGVVETDAMPFEDYVACRTFGLSVEIFYNDGYFSEVQGLLRHLGLSMFDFVERCHALAVSTDTPLAPFYAGLEEAVRSEGDDERRDAADSRRWRPAASLGVLKGLAINEHTVQVHELADAVLNAMLAPAPQNAGLREYAQQLLRFSLLRKERLIDERGERRGRFDFDFARIAEQGFACDPVSARLPAPMEFRFWHTPEQRSELDSIAEQYADPVQRGLMLAFPRLAQHVTPMFRQFAPVVDGRAASANADAQS